MGDLNKYEKNIVECMDQTNHGMAGRKERKNIYIC